MLPFLDQIFLILTTSPGNLAYHLILAFSIAGALQSSINHWRRTGYPQGQRMVIGLTLLLLVQLIQFAMAALSWQGVIDPEAFLPPLDRLVILLSLVIIAWIWLFPEPSRLADAATLLLSFLVIAASIVSLLWWREQPLDQPYNGTLADIGSDILAIVLIGVNFLILLMRRPNGWGFSVSFFGLMLLGFGLRWWAPQPESDYAGIVRLAQLMAYPLLFSLPLRFPLPVETALVASQAPAASLKEIRRYRADPAFISELLGLAVERNPLQLKQKMTRLVSELMVADVALLLSPPDEAGQIVVSTGYNLIKQQPISSFSVETRSLPVLASALRRGRIVRLPSSSTSTDLMSLARPLNLERAGHLLAAPLLAVDGSVRQGLVLLLPYSNRGWTLEDQENLARFANIFSDMLSRLEAAPPPVAHDSTMATAPEESVAEFSAQLEELQQQLSLERQRAENLASLVADLSDYQQRITELEQEALSWQAAVESQRRTSAAEIEAIQGELRLALEELAQLRRSQADAAAELPVAASTPASPLPAGMPVEKYLQEIRQPLKSLHDNVHSLLSAAVQSGSAGQLKSLERVKASVERLTILLDDWARAIELNASLATSPPALVALKDFIDHVVREATPQFHQRSIDLRLNVPEQLPVASVNANALQQILENLLSYFSSTSTQNSQVSLTVNLQSKENEPDFLFLQVVDPAQTVDADDLPRLFSRLLPPARLTQPVAQKLAAVKALVEAQDGRVWADPLTGQGLIINVLLPVQVVSAPLHSGDSIAT